MTEMAKMFVSSVKSAGNMDETKKQHTSKQDAESPNAVTSSYRLPQHHAKEENKIYPGETNLK